MAGIYRSKQARRDAYTGRLKWALDLLKEYYPTGEVIGVEVGFWKGDFGKLMLDNDPRLHWIAVDPYEEYGKRRRKQPQWDGIYEKVRNKLSVHEGRITFIRERSENGVAKVPDNVHFVWIDGNHDYDVVKKDIELYEKKVRSGGILSGHDYHHQRIKDAVDEYAEEHGRELHLETGFDACTVFWWEVP